MRERDVEAMVVVVVVVVAVVLKVLVEEEGGGGFYGVRCGDGTLLEWAVYETWIKTIPNDKWTIQFFY